MVTPITSQALPVVMPGTQPETDNQVQRVESAEHVQPPVQAESHTQNYKRWPHRPPMGDIIEPEKSSLDTALEQLNENMKAWSTGVRFDVDPDSQRLVVSLVNNESGEVIRTVPSDAVLQISRMIAKFQGNSINTKA